MLQSEDLSIDHRPPLLRSRNLKLCALWGDVIFLCGRLSLFLQIVAFYRLALRSTLGS